MAYNRDYITFACSDGLAQDCPKRSLLLVQTAVRKSVRTGKSDVITVHPGSTGDCRRRVNTRFLGHRKIQRTVVWVYLKESIQSEAFLIESLASPTLLTRSALSRTAFLRRSKLDMRAVTVLPRSCMR